MRVTFIKPNIGRLEHSLYVDEGRMAGPVARLGWDAASSSAL